MIELTEHLLPHAQAMNEAFTLGVLECHLRNPPRLHFARDNWRYCRGRHGLQGAPPILTYGKANLKLGKSEMFTVGYTGKQHVQRIGRLIVNACPHAGDCVKVCVLDGGRAQMDPRIKRARRARNELLAKHPTDWAYLVGRELGRVAVKYPDGFLFRPDVATDVCWELLLPAMTSGSAIPWMTSYGYSKWPYVLDGDGWLDSAYRVAYSWNEDSVADDVEQFLARGGNVAMVTSRRKGEDVMTFDQAPVACSGIVDADLTDEWIINATGAIGDLSAKGKARQLIGKSGFVVTVN